MTIPTTPQDDDDAHLAAFIRIMNARFGDNPKQKSPPEPWVDKPPKLVGAEAEVFRWQMVERFQRLTCSDIMQCKDKRCRRKRRCRELAAIEPLAKVAQARLAEELAKWQASTEQKDAPELPR
jgi:hypothetical protein